MCSRATKVSAHRTGECRREGPRQSTKRRYWLKSSDEMAADDGHVRLTIGGNTRRVVLKDAIQCGIELHVTRIEQVDLTSVDIQIELNT